MYEKEMAEKNKILVVRSGSWLYGLNTSTSDEDYVGIFIPDIEYLLGFKTCEQVDMGYKSKLENGKNSSEAIDCTFYSITKFVNLALNGNPNILEILFVNEENIVYINDYGRRLLSMRDKFLSEKVEATFFGYAKSQKRKIEVKRDTYLNLVNAMEYLKPFDNKYLLEIQLEDSEKFVSHFKDKDKYLFGLGDISINKNITAKKACSVIKDRIGECGNRIDLIKDRGYDCYTDDTEFLTNNGWKKYDDIKSTDKLATTNKQSNLEFQSYKNRIKKEIDDYVYEYSNNYTNFCVTENHRLLVSEAHRNPANNYSTKYNDEVSNWDYKTVKDINNSNRSNFHVKNNIINNNLDYDIDDDLLICMGLFLADGTFNFRNKNLKSIRICKTNKGKPVFLKLIDSISEKYKFKKYSYVRKEKDTIENYYISHDKQLCNFIFENCGHGSKNKYLPNFIFKLSKRQCDLLINSMWAGDGSIKNKYNDVYYTSSNKLANGFQILCLMAERDVNIYDYCHKYDTGFSKKENNDMYQVSYSKNIGIPKIIRISHEMKKYKTSENGSTNTGGNKIKYSGSVVCFEVENENLITRRKGKISIQGNCKFTSHTIRLMSELKEIARDHTLTFPIKENRDIIMKAKTGEYSVDESMEIIEKVESECREFCENLKGLTCDRKYVEKEVLQIIKDVNGWN